MSLRVEAVAHIEYRKKIYQKSVVGFLVKFPSLGRRIFQQFGLDLLKKLRNQLLFVKLQSFEQNYHQFDARVNIPIV